MNRLLRRLRPIFVLSVRRRPRCEGLSPLPLPVTGEGRGEGLSSSSLGTGGDRNSEIGK